MRRLLASAAARLAEWNHERKLRYLSYGRQARVWLTRPRRGYETLSFEELRRRRRSDTLFILGSGPSIRAVTPGQWAAVARHDSFGINWSILLDFVPTYQIMEDGKVAWHRTLTRQILAPRRGKLAPTVWFISNKDRRRLIHPLYMPELFPDPARACQFQLPPRLLLDRDRPFTAADFEGSLRYRGTMSVAIGLAVGLGYRRIVLLGVDLQTPHHFFEDLEEVRGYAEHVSRDQVDDTQVFPVMRPKPGTFRPLDEYLVGLNDLYLRPRGIELYVGNRASVLRPRLPYFAGWDD